MFIVELQENHRIGEFGDGVRRHHATPSNHKRSILSHAANTGTKFASTDPRPRAVQPRPCTDHPSKPIFKCHTITEAERQECLDAYWKQGSRKGRWSSEANSLDSVSSRYSMLSMALLRHLITLCTLALSHFRQHPIEALDAALFLISITSF